MQKLKIAYFGSPSFSATLLEKIINDKELPVEVELVITQPDMPVGRKQILTATPVKLMAKKYQLPIIYSTELRVSNDQLSITNDQSIINDPMINNKSTEIEKLRIEHLLNIERLNIDHLDLALVYAYGEILPKETLDLPKYGFWNVHPSLLPKYRGASPIAYPLILGDKKTGVSLMLMDEKMDHGPIIAQEEMEIKPNDTRPNLENKLTDLAFLMFKKLITTVQKKAQTPVSNDLGGAQSRTSGTSTPTGLPTVASAKVGVRNTASSFIKGTFQDHSQATYAPYLKKSDGFIPLSILKKAINNEPLKFTNLPEFLQNYLIKYPNSQLSMINQ
ncbi:MAG: methionyl-tRNA formyltransferase, partial [Candidatus Omnitrophica bacterium]|nr:methionyl-tRNA formyltransferase [Candidatus Omnitrophota bacterium]